MNNDILKYQDKKQGTYKISSEVNGKPSWTSSSMAIWYIPESKVWGIGPVGSIGSSFIGIFGSKNGMDYPYEIKEWKYVIDKDTIETATENDISIKCSEPCQTISVTLKNDALDAQGMYPF